MAESATPRISQLLKLAQPFYDNGDAAHDMAHIHRVIANCRKFAHGQPVNLEILLAGAILHDVVNLPKNHPERLAASQMAAQRSQEILEGVGFTTEEIAKIREVIVEHSYSLGKKPSSLESAILQDADKIDAIGAIGVMRTITVGTRMGRSSFYSPVDPFAENRELEDKKFFVDHFFVKTLKLHELMNTDAAKVEAKRRTEYMHGFLKQLESEI